MSGTDREGNNSSQNSSNNESDEDKFRSHFWTKIQNELGMCIPRCVKNILQFNNLDNPVSFRGISDAIIKELENFAKTVMPSLVDENSEDLKEYYGIFYKKPQNFTFVIGDRILLKKLVEFVNTKPFDYWGDISTSTQRNMTSSGDTFNVDTEAEKKKLQRQITTMQTKNRSQFSESMRSSFEKGVVINVTASVMPSKTYGINDITYEAHITCPLCSTVISFKKIAETGKPEKRWVMSNFKRHIMMHSTKESDRTLKRTNSERQIRTEQSATTGVTALGIGSGIGQQMMVLNDETLNVHTRIQDSTMIQVENPSAIRVAENPPPFVVPENLLTNHAATSATSPTTDMGRVITVLSSVDNFSGE